MLEEGAAEDFIFIYVSLIKSYNQWVQNYKPWTAHPLTVKSITSYLTKAEVPTTALNKWMPRIQMIRQKRPAAPSELYSCGVPPGSEMYPNTTWLDTKRFRGKNLLQCLEISSQH